MTSAYVRAWTIQLAAGGRHGRRRRSRDELADDWRSRTTVAGRAPLPGLGGAAAGRIAAALDLVAGGLAARHAEDADRPQPAADVLVRRWKPQVARVEED